MREVVCFVNCVCVCGRYADLQLLRVVIVVQPVSSLSTFVFLEVGIMARLLERVGAANDEVDAIGRLVVVVLSCRSCVFDPKAIKLGRSGFLWNFNVL